MKRPWLWLAITTNLVGLVALAFAYPNAMVAPGPLAPDHARLATECFACHAPFRGATSDRCVACHAPMDIGVRSTSGDPVMRRNASATRAAFHSELTEPDCMSCHSDHGLPAARRFSHDLLRQPAREDCAGCHPPPLNDRHRDLRVSCAGCHSTERWTPAAFDHASLTSGELAQCESCHAAPTDSFHRQRTSGCAQCHSPGHWKPSSFEHGRFFSLDRDHNVACATCHTNDDFTRYTCFGCHEHTPANIRAEHEEEGIRSFDDCVSCHRSADGEGGEHGERRGDGDDD